MSYPLQSCCETCFFNFALSKSTGTLLHQYLNKERTKYISFRMAKVERKVFLVDNLSFYMCFTWEKWWIWYFDKNFTKAESVCVPCQKCWKLKIEYLKVKSKDFNEMFEEGEVKWLVSTGKKQHLLFEKCWLTLYWLCCNIGIGASKFKNVLAVMITYLNQRLPLNIPNNSMDEVVSTYSKSKTVLSTTLEQTCLLKFMLFSLCGLGLYVVGILESGMKR